VPSAAERPDAIGRVRPLSGPDLRLQPERLHRRLTRRRTRPGAGQREPHACSRRLGRAEQAETCAGLDHDRGCGGRAIACDIESFGLNRGGCRLPRPLPWRSCSNRRYRLAISRSQTRAGVRLVGGYDPEARCARLPVQADKANDRRRLVDSHVEDMRNFGVFPRSPPTRPSAWLPLPVGIVTARTNCQDGEARCIVR